MGGRLKHVVSFGALHQAGGTAIPPARWRGGEACCYQPMATTMYCGLVTEMSEDCPLSSS